MIPAWMNPERFDLYQPHLTAGFAKAGKSKSMGSFNVAPFVTCAMGDLEATQMPIKALLGFYIGGMGARSKNFYNDYANAKEGLLSFIERREARFTGR
ncbi:MAG: hypothetical protein HY268_05915 [Deltaproteobacteria bacterium]|nr:hypothetical protein [Deltaproteobacteria bacterium]